MFYLMVILRPMYVHKHYHCVSCPERFSLERANRTYILHWPTNSAGKTSRRPWPNFQDQALTQHKTRPIWVPAALKSNSSAVYFKHIIVDKRSSSRHTIFLSRHCCKTGLRSINLPCNFASTWQSDWKFISLPICYGNKTWFWLSPGSHFTHEDLARSWCSWPVQDSRALFYNIKFFNEGNIQNTRASQGKRSLKNNPTRLGPKTSRWHGFWAPPLCKPWKKGLYKDSNCSRRWKKYWSQWRILTRHYREKATPSQIFRAGSEYVFFSVQVKSQVSFSDIESSRKSKD